MKTSSLLAFTKDDLKSMLFEISNCERFVDNRNLFWTEKLQHCMKTIIFQLKSLNHKYYFYYLW